MKNTKPIFTCSFCGAQYQKWIGRCLECGHWGTIQEEKITNKSDSNEENYKLITTKKITEIKETGKNKYRFSTAIKELDRVLGGGFVPGSLILLGGEPGIGKSTLALQIIDKIKKSLYISAEESIQQIKLRIDRLKIKNKDIQLANEDNLENIIYSLKKIKPNLVIIDSIQTIFSQESSSEIGSINQIKIATAKLMELAKKENIIVLVIGHVTKDGVVAGPKTLEHMVDTVLYLEGSRYQNYRLLRTIKNRFGATDEIGLFNMTENGLIEIDNPAGIFLSSQTEEIPGSIITCVLEGTRPVLVEVQALVNKTAFGYPTRKASGFDINRLHVLIAVLQKRAGLNLNQYDIHLNIVGGLKINEPAIDLAVCLAIASSFKNKKITKNLVVFGEIGLGGEVRPVFQTEKRIKECENLGIKKIICPPQKNFKKYNLKIFPVKNLQELILKNT